MLPALGLLLAPLVIFAIGYGAFRIPALNVMRILAAHVGIDLGTVDSRQVAVLNRFDCPA